MHDPVAEALVDLTRPGMGTEAAGPFLRSLARLLRPCTAVEVGAGATTLHLLLGLRDARAEAADDRLVVRGRLDSPERASVLHPKSALKDYAPRLHVVDDVSVPGTSADRVQSIATSLGLDGVLTFIEQDFFSLTEDDIDGWGPLDLVWLDAGSQGDDARFLATLWPRVAPGGVVVLHEPYLATTVETLDARGVSRMAGKVVPSPLLQELRRQAAQPDSGFDVLALGEAHKFRQAGLLLLRKRGAWERDRGVPFPRELRALGEPHAVPAPGLAPSAGSSDGAHADEAGSVLAALADDTRRSVYGAVTLRADTTARIAERVGIAPVPCAKALAVLEQAALVERTGQVWSPVTEVWRRIAPRRVHPRTRASIPAKQSKRRVFLKEIVPLFSHHRRYAEAEVNGILRDVHPDVAALRRYLVEEGLLTRADGVYWRP
ncbi:MULTISPECIES: DUF2087 domain-containing protein [Streptomyces]|uniref:DUF2087 domain-containing protein n=1 Tax=Streptomyces xinghaiensis TaxID=1038928 RepID=A0A3R7HHE8_9ACTN|nr:MULTISPECIES: DUF2087 domain-containing protein [Streptomyces]PQM20090.1 DUF2087 domain-containing protein [Streptomyces xinghaiensis]RKM96014.1 DUF2087 domain-containing protein [Streptomyces xinghaiensis]RNC69971.1 DUF2087 domain-containing protein [Streptomyces xinghaiensis]